MKTSLLITEECDPTADNLIQVMRLHGFPYLRWNMDRFPDGSALTYRAAADGFDGVISADGRSIPFTEIGSVWNRALRPRGFPSNFTPEECEFAGREAEGVLDALPRVTDWFWINDPHAHRMASAKPAQLAVARRLGLAIPRTIISNNPEVVRQFCNDCPGEVIFKSLSAGQNLEAGKAVFTGVVTGKVVESLDLIQHTPGIFQERVAKDYELRVTVVADHIFAAKILSQQNERTRVDWRVAPYDIRYEPIELPSELCSKIIAFMTEFDLAYSCLDFIVTPDGQAVFLESNPRGQYLWIEHYAGLPITVALAHALAEGGRR